MLNDIVPSLIKEGIKEHLKGINVDLPDTIGIEEAAKVTGLKTKSIYSKVCGLEMPTLKRGMPLIYIVEIYKIFVYCIFVLHY